MLPGAVHLIDNSRTYRETGTYCAQQNAFVPAADIGYDPGEHPVCLSIPENSPVGRMLVAGFETLFDGLAQGHAQHASTHFKLLMKYLLTAPREGRANNAFQAARAEAMRRFLQARLTKPGLGIEDLRRTFGASRSTIFRDFAEAGGVDAYIRDLRLAQAYLDLAESGVTRGDITRLAERFDFGTVASFSRKFTQKFGERPSDVSGRFAREGRAADPAGLAALAQPPAEHARAAETYGALYRQLRVAPAR